jgi:formylglycine-generating enzyme required for sulfatase activity
VNLEDESNSKDTKGVAGTKGGRYEVKAFQMAKYPITNAQFQVFVDAPDGYKEAGWWGFSKDAQQWRSKNSQPQATAFKGDDLPRTNVNWYTSVAFCYWLSWKMGVYPDVNAIAQGVLSPIRLPTEQEWQRAAQGDDSRKYPWGNQQPTKDLCNFDRNVGQTTSVTAYPKGASPFGVFDMAGNVLEWCLTAWGNDQTEVNISNNARVLRGGSWYFTYNFVRAAGRYRNNPNNENIDVGFRCALSY